jgi:ribosomal protein S18 acetylase RimI-like enzyme
MTVAIRRIQEHDWALAKALRLRALAEAPDAFAATLADEQAMDDGRWRARAQSNAEGRSTIGYLALCDGIEVGLAVGVRPASEPEIVELNALWVAPEVRARGAGSALVAAVCGWARELGVACVALEVTETSHAAKALYRKLGFEVVGELPAGCGRRRAPALRMHKRTQLPG